MLLNNLNKKESNLLTFWYCTVENIPHHSRITKLQAWCWITLFILNYSYSYQIKLWTINLGCLPLLNLPWPENRVWHVELLESFQCPLFPRSIWCCNDSVFSSCKSMSVPLTLVSHYIDKTMQLYRARFIDQWHMSSSGHLPAIGIYSIRENLLQWKQESAAWREVSVIIRYFPSSQAVNQLAIV